MDGEKRKLKLLCLHGYAQSATKFRGRLAALRRKLKNDVEFTFVDAPHVLPTLPSDGGAQNEEEAVSPARAWWTYEIPEDPLLEKTKIEEVIHRIPLGVKETLSHIESAFEQDGPFDGVLGFSQGAVLAAILCVLAQQSNSRLHGLRFGIFVSGFTPTLAEYRSLFADVIDMPTLHIFGRTDMVVPSEMSAQLADSFRAPIRYVHEGGHFLPTNAAAMTPLRDFVQKMRTLAD